MNKQLCFNLKFTPSLNWEDFCVSEANIEAIKWLRSFEKLPIHILTICGPELCGKSHLGTLWAKAEQAYNIIPKTFTERPLEVFKNASHFLIDDAKLLLSNMEWSFHFFNLAIGSQKKILILDRDFVTNWDIPLRDLKSRLLMSPCVKIKDPDENLMQQIAKKLLHDAGIIIPEKKLEKQIHLLERSYISITNFVNTINNSYSLHRSVSKLL